MTLTDFAELVGIVRDVIVIITFLLFSFLLVGLLFLYRKLSRLADSVKRTMASAEQVADAISSKLAGPISAGSGVAFGLGKAVAFLGRLRRNKKGKGGQQDGEQ